MTDKKELKVITDKKEISPVLDMSIEDLNKVLEEIRPYLAMDGGDMEVVGMKGLEIHMKLHGACDGCPHAGLTMKYGIENLLREKVHEEIEVMPV